MPSDIGYSRHHLVPYMDADIPNSPFSYDFVLKSLIYNLKREVDFIPRMFGRLFLGLNKFYSNIIFDNHFMESRYLESMLELEFYQS